MPRRKKSLTALHPELAKQWHPTKNGDLTPHDVVPGSGKKVWWKCPKGPDHEWATKICHRTGSAKSGCPFCAGKRLSVTNSLAALRPDLAAEWNAEKNGGSPERQLAGGSKPAWWKCSKGPDHEWRATLNNRTRGAGCPFCANKKVSVTNSLVALFPEVAREWHAPKNQVTADTVVATSEKRIWWKCPKGPDHEWQASVSQRTQRGSGCPFCARHRLSVTNNLKAVHPELAAEWHPRNKLGPADIVAGANRKVWWRCAANQAHEWEAYITNRMRGTGCPFCANQRASRDNSLATLHPAVAAEFHPTKNKNLRPAHVPASSGKRVWWRCPKGRDHEWQAQVYRRTVEGTGCPFCAGQRASVTNSLAALGGALVEEWDAEKNGVSAHAVVAGSQKQAWWRCRACDCSWSATISNRTRLNAGCPKCGTGWRVDVIRDFVRGILPHLATLTPAELFAIFQQSGLLDTHGKGRGFAKALATGRFPNEDLKRFAEDKPSLVDDFIADADLTLETLDAETDLDRVVADEQVVRVDDELPVVQTKQALATLDSKLVASSDEEAVKFLIASAKAKIWTHAYVDEDAAVAQAEAHQGDAYAEHVRQEFLAEYAAAKCLRVPSGYSFTIDGRRIRPNLMQRLVAVRVRERRRFGNWSGTGAGKTLSAILASRVVGADLTLVCCPNSVVDGWARAIKATYPKAMVATKTWEPKWNGSKSGRQKSPRYLIQNYEQFQQPNSEEELSWLVAEERVDFIVIDEVHFAKQRHAENMSRRKRLIMGLVAAEGEANPDLCVLGMSATPVINNLQEGKSLVELMTGVAHEDLLTRATVPNCMRLHQRFVTLGTRWKPQYDPKLEGIKEHIDCGASLDEIRTLDSRGGSPLGLEQILTEVRLPVILKHLKPKTLVYTHYVQGIVKPLYKAITREGWKVGMFTGDDKTGLDGFIGGDIDVLVASSAISTGVDGLQQVCNQLIVNVLPWTNAEFEQLKGRIWRQGQRAEKVTVVIPVTFAEVGGQRWSWCESKLARLHFKKSVADAAVDGIVPEGHLRSPEQAYRDVLAWLTRLEAGDIGEVVRRRIVVPLSTAKKDVTRRNRRYGVFSRMNARWNQTASAMLHKRLADNPEEWGHYHTFYGQARQSWTVVPFQEVIEWLADREGKVVGDFGCGEALIAKAVADRHEVHSFDHVAIDETVTACDMVHTGLDDETLDVAVFSLSLMGSNVTDYLREAHRTLKLDGMMHIWEATSRFDTPERFAANLKKLGFDVLRVEERAQFTQIQAVKTSRRAAKNVVLGFGDSGTPRRRKR